LLLFAVTQQCPNPNISDHCVTAVAREALAGVAGNVAWLEDRDEIEASSRTQPLQNAEERAERMAEAEDMLVQMVLSNVDTARTAEAHEYARAYARAVVADIRSKQEAEARQKEQQAADTRQRCLLAIGDHVEGARWPAWLGGLVTKPLLWQFAAAATRNKANGEQMARMYLRMRRQQDQQAAGTASCHHHAPFAVCGHPLSRPHFAYPYWSLYVNCVCIA
jgi:hypothetical protein